MGIGRVYVSELRGYDIFHNQITGESELALFNSEWSVVSLFHVDNELLYTWIAPRDIEKKMWYFS